MKLLTKLEEQFLLFLMSLDQGLLESVYEATLTYELTTLGLKVRNQVPVPVIYKEVKSLELIHNVHKKQLLTYLRLSNKKLDILVNFNSDKLVDKESILRIIN